MSSRNPRSFAAYRAAKFPRATRAAIVAQRRHMNTKRLVVPGITRTAGAYRRSNPKNHEETHYNDCTFGTAAAIAGTIPTMTSVSPSAAAPDNPAVASLVGIKQSTTKNTRIGNRLSIYRIRVKGQILLPTEVEGDTVRMMLVLDKQANGATPNVNTVLEGNGAGGAATLTDFLNMDNADRFQVLKDKQISINPLIGVSSTSSSPMYLHWKMSHKCNLRIDYSSTAGAVTEYKSNNLFLIFISQNGFPYVFGTSRIYWKE